MPIPTIPYISFQRNNNSTSIPGFVSDRDCLVTRTDLIRSKPPTGSSSKVQPSCAKSEKKKKQIRLGRRKGEKEGQNTAITRANPILINKTQRDQQVVCSLLLAVSPTTTDHIPSSCALQNESCRLAS